MTRHRFCHSVSVGSPSAEVNRQICWHDAVLDERPLNNKCPKIAENQSTNKVGENNTEGTNTHCADSSSHADSVDRLKPIVLATDNPDRCDACSCCDPDTRDARVSLSQSTEVTVAESDKDAINTRVNLLPVAINSPQPVRRDPRWPARCYTVPCADWSKVSPRMRRAARKQCLCFRAQSACCCC